MEPLRPNAQRAKAAITVLYIIMGLGIAVAVTELLLFFVYPTNIFAYTGSVDSIVALSVTLIILGILYFIAYIVSAVFFILWFRRAYYNLGLRTKLTESDGWAAGAWFVPILNLFRPYQMMKEMYLTTGRIFKKYLGSVPAGFTMKHLGWWWGLWIAGNITSRISSRIGNNTEDLAVVKYSMLVDFFVSFLVLGACFLAIRVIKVYAAVEPVLAELKPDASGAASPAPATEPPVSNNPVGQDPFA